MKACFLRAPAKVESNPLVFGDVPKPEPLSGEILIRVEVCGVCRTDLHVIEGELPPKKLAIIPGHQAVGHVAGTGAGAGRLAIGSRVGVAWLHKTDGNCEYCRRGKENLCDHPQFTGYTVNGGYAEFLTAPEDFVYPLPENLAAEQAGPLPLRRNHRLPVLAFERRAGGRQVGIVRLWGRRPRGRSGGSSLGRGSVRFHP
jgi:propanol-preferring alcohol dehydrogenase